MHEETKRHVLSILVENHSGVLARVSSLFSRRGYNIDCLSVGETHSTEVSRITIVVRGDNAIIEQIKKQVEKLVDVIRVVTLATDSAVFRELVLVKVAADPETRPSIAGIVDIFRARIIDVAPHSVTVELTGDQPKIQAFVELMQPYGIRELVRTGLTALQRGDGILKCEEF